jgi:hypothetical protein
MSIIELPATSELGTLKAKKSFWNLTHQRAEKENLAKDESGYLVIAGHAGEDQKTINHIVTLAPLLVAFIGQLHYFENGDFDYIEIGSKHDETNGAPYSYAGISGGSLWRVRIVTKSGGGNPEMCFEGATLAGVPFYQIPEDCGRVKVRAHGPKTLYQNMVSCLISKNHCNEFNRVRPGIANSLTR